MLCAHSCCVEQSSGAMKRKWGEGYTTRPPTWHLLPCLNWLTGDPADEDVVRCRQPVWDWWQVLSRLSRSPLQHTDVALPWRVGCWAPWAPLGRCPVVVVGTAATPAASMARLALGHACRC